jgi:peptide/nickel transport system substrate-binding protein
MADYLAICRLGDIADPGAKEFEIENRRGQKWYGFVVRKGEDVYAYANSCPHTGAMLNWGPDRFLTRAGDLIMCGVHGAQFEIDVAQGLAKTGSPVAALDPRVEPGVYERDGERLSITFTEISEVPVSENEALQTKNQLEQIGFEVEIVSIPAAEFSSTLDNREFQLIAFTWVGSPFPFAGVDQIYGTGGDSNYGNSNLPDVDALIPGLAAELDFDERVRIANEIDTLLWENTHTLPLYQRPDLYAVSADFANFGAFGLIRIDWAAEYENWGWME